MKNIDKAANLLPLGYIFLVVLGITKESIFYYQIGINIIRYSSIMDILISPIAAITSHPVFFITILVLFIFYYNLPKILLKNEDKRWLHNFFYKQKKNTELPQERLPYYGTVALESFSFFLISIFLGYGFADGRTISNKIKNNKIDYDYKLNYNNEKSENVYIIGSNTAYYFYLTKGNPAIKIAPVNSITNLEMIKNRMLNNNQ